MWLTSSSVGRKFIMALTGAFLVLFVTFHCLMNSVAILWPAAYNLVCEFLGANWYALAASAILAAFIIVHIIYASVLTIQNNKARGHEKYAITSRPKSVEWSSKNMYVLGIVILAFLIVHLIQFWAKMQLVEVLGCESQIPPVAGTLFIQEAFAQPWTPVVYIIGFIALWFHMNHGFWSMFQSVGWDNTTWIPRLKKISCWWVSIVILLFVAQAVIFTVRANEGYYLTNEELRAQYKDMIVPMIEEEMGAEGAQMGNAIKNMPYEQVSQGIRQMNQQMSAQLEQMKSPQMQQVIKSQPGGQEQLDAMAKQAAGIQRAAAFLDYLEQNDPQTDAMQMQMTQQPR
ncbi:MAG: succinate dehydrogenase cytochrome b subunit [Muribaculaceae bacterium]|nr:succinate dehydrogenase cytochrome b subunit [Muribaculaceae bacterium]